MPRRGVAATRARHLRCARCRGRMVGITGVRHRILETPDGRQASITRTRCHSCGWERPLISFVVSTADEAEAIAELGFV